jgi:hypothetical protein
MEEKKYRWLVKESLFAEWRELQGEHTPKDIWFMRWQGKFWAAKLMEPRSPAGTAIPPE